MKIGDLKDINKDDILGALGLQTRQSSASWLLGSLGLFGLGMVVGAGVALLVAPKPGAELRRDLEGRIKTVRERVASATNGALETSI